MKRWCAALLCVCALGCDRKDAEPWVDTEPDAGEFAVVSVSPAEGAQLPGQLAQVELVFNRPLSVLSVRQNDNLRLSSAAEPAADADAGDLGEADAGEADAGAAEVIVTCNVMLQKSGTGHEVKLLPLAALAPETTYTVTVETTVVSENGEMLAAPFRSSFTTGSY